MGDVNSKWPYVVEAVDSAESWQQSPGEVVQKKGTFLTEVAAMFKERAFTKKYSVEEVVTNRSAQETPASVVLSNMILLATCGYLNRNELKLEIQLLSLSHRSIIITVLLPNTGPIDDCFIPKYM